MRGQIYTDRGTRHLDLFIRLLTSNEGTRMENQRRSPHSHGNTGGVGNVSVVIVNGQHTFRLRRRIS